MDANRDIQLLLLALREHMVDPDRLTAAAADWSPRTGLIAHLAARGILSPETLERLHAATIDHPAAVRDGDPGLLPTPRVAGDGDATTDHPGEDTPAAQAGSTFRVPAATGRYSVLRLHQSGGLGQVWLARDTAVGREVALKTLRPERAAAESARSRFLREARVTGQLEHPSIVPLYDLALDGADPFYVMRFISGRTLAEAAGDYHKRRAAGTAGPLDLNTLLDAFINVCRAVAFAHSRNVLHRDLKGQNIVVGEYGETFLLDWGLAKSVGEMDESTPTMVAGEEGATDLTKTGAAIGTPAYMAPEVAAGQLATKASDVYGLGAILHAVLAGRPPYSGSTAAEVLQKVAVEEPTPVTEANPGAPPALIAVCRRAMARGPADRYSSAEEVATEVRRWLADEPVHAYREPLPARVSRWARRRKTAVVAAAVLLATAAIASTAAAGLLWREEQKTKFAWDQAEKERVKATDNADTAITVVHDLSEYVQQVESVGTRSSVTDRQRKDTLKSAVSSYERLLALHPEDPAVRSNVARLHQYHANTSRLLNEIVDAESSYRESTRHFGELAEAHPENLDYRQRGSDISRDFAIFLKNLGRLKDATEKLSGSIGVYEELLRVKPDEISYQRQLASMLLDRSELDYQLGRFVESEHTARAAAEIYGKLAEVPASFLQSLDAVLRGASETRLGIALRELDRIDEAIATHDIVVKRLVEQTRVTPDRDLLHQSHRAKFERARTLSRVPNRRPAALKDLDEAILGWEKLIKQFPTPTYSNFQASAILHRGRVKALLDQRDHATEDLIAAGRILEGLENKNPNLPAYSSELAQVYLARGGLAVNPVEAAGWYGKSRALLEKSIKQSPENVHYRRVWGELQVALNAKKS